MVDCNLQSYKYYHDKWIKMVNFKWKVKGDTSVGQRKNLSPDRNQIQDLTNA